MNFFRNNFCNLIYVYANRIVSRCRSDQERQALEKSFNKHFKKVHEDAQKALELERILSKKDELIDAVKSIQDENYYVKEEKNDLECFIAQLQEENETLNSLIALICELHAKHDWENLNALIFTLSNKYIRQ